MKKNKIIPVLVQGKAVFGGTIKVTAHGVLSSCANCKVKTYYKPGDPCKRCGALLGELK